MKSFLESLKERALLGDGAMGTELQRAGLEPGGCGELWNLTQPERVLAIQKAYVEAGSDCLLTNTFGGSRIALERHELGNRVEEINQAAVKIARQAFGNSPGYVLGDMGPCAAWPGQKVDVSPEQVRAAFREHARALVEAGVDAIILETQTSLEELAIGIEEARRAGASCVIGSLAFDVAPQASDPRTMLRVVPQQAAEFLQQAGADVAAFNCGRHLDMSWAIRILRDYRKTCDLLLMAQPNAGSPASQNSHVVYRETPESMAAGVPELLQAGARVVGGCCGTTPDHIRAFCKIIDEWNLGADPIARG